MDKPWKYEKGPTRKVQILYDSLIRDIENSQIHRERKYNSGHQGLEIWWRREWRVRVLRVEFK